MGILLETVLLGAPDQPPQAAITSLAQDEALLSLFQRQERVQEKLLGTCSFVVGPLIAAREASRTEQTASGFRVVASLSCWVALQESCGSHP